MTDSDTQRSTGERLGLAALLLAASQLLSRVLGFLRDAVIAYLHGATYATDAYHVAFQLPGYLSYLLAGGTLSITFIPIFSEYINNDDEEGGWRLFSTIATVVGLILLVAVVLLEIFTPQLLFLAAPGFDDPKQVELAVAMTRIVLPAQIGFIIGGLVQATLYVREIFWPSAVAPLVYNLCIILGGICLNPWFGIKGFAIGALTGALLGPLGLRLWAARDRIVYRPRFSLSHPGFKEFIALSLPLMIGVSLIRVDKWLLQIFGSGLEHGSITWLKNARKVMMVLFALIGQAIGQAALPFLANLFQRGDSEQVSRLLGRNIQRGLFLGALATAGLVVIAKPAVYLIFRHGAFSATDADMTAKLLIIFALGLVGWISQSIAVRGFYARKDTLTPMLVGTASVAVSIPLYYVLNQYYQAVGLAAATSIGITITAINTVGVYQWKVGGLPFGRIGRGFLRGTGFAVCCGLAAWFVRIGLRPWLSVQNIGQNIGMLVSMGGAFGLTAIGLSAAFNPPEAEYVRKTIREKWPGSSENPPE